MIWSFSKYREYSKCQRKWFLNDKMGSRSLKDKERREIYQLSELESIDAWRGKIVEYTIEKYILPRIKKNILINEVLDFAKNIARKRYEFARQQTYKTPNLKKTEHSIDYCALYAFEYLENEKEIKQSLKKAWDDIENALTNFINNEELIKYLASSEYFVFQRAIQFQYHDWTVKCVPDLIILSKSQPPHIFDWKVHFFGTRTYNDQLSLYALALTKCAPHKDFKDYLISTCPSNIKLSEYQLLKNVIRDYKITIEDVEELHDSITEGIYSMQLKRCGDKYEDLRIEDFEKTNNIEHCKHCSFKKICREDE